MKVVILGAGQIFMNVIAGCMDAGCDIVGVLRCDKVRFTPFERFLIDTFNPSVELNYIKSHKLYEIKARSANSAEFKKEILRLNADLVLVATWGEKIKKTIINLPTIATVNVHPALLPKYRGPNPYLQTIKHLEKESGVTFHLMDENFDTGAILHQKRVEIKPEDTGTELRLRIAKAAREGVRELLLELDKEVVIPVAQDENKASYFPQISQDDVMLDFSKSAEKVAAHIRAFHPWHKCYFEYGKEFFVPNPYQLEILENKSQIIEPGKIIDKSVKERSLTVLCGDGKAIKMSKVRLYGALWVFTPLFIKFRVKLN